MKTYKVECEEMPETIEAESLNEAVKIAHENLGVREEIEYCSNCEKEIKQIDLGNGSFGCPICKRDDCIELN